MESHIEHSARHHPSPISRLSSDILEYIFLMSAQDITDQAKHRLKLVLSISRVCKLWRQIVFNYPTLWSHVIDYSGSPAEVRTLLKLSQQSSLRYGTPSAAILFVHDEDDVTNAEVLGLLFDQIPRLRTFNFDSTPGAKKSWSMIRTKLLPYPAPHLTYLGLHRTPTNNPIYLAKVPLFDDHAPALRSLHLEGYLIRLDLCPRLLGNLSELQVKEIGPHRGTPSLENWVQILKLSPQLQWLVIVDAISHLSTSIRNSSVSLNKLKMLYIQAPQHHCAELLHAVSIPATCGVRLEAGIDRNGESLEPLYYFMSQRISPSAVSERWWMIQCWDSINGSEAEITLMNRPAVNYGVGQYFCPGWDSPDDRSSSGKSDSFVYFALRFSRHTQGDMPRLYAMLLDSFAPTYPSITTLFISFHGLTNKHRSTFQRPIADRLHLFQNVKRLELSDGWHHGTHPYFSTLMNPRSGAILLPSLHEIQFASGTIEEPRPSEFFEFVRYRKASGLPIHKVELDDVEVDKRLFVSEIGEAVECLDLSRGFGDPVDSFSELE